MSCSSVRKVVNWRYATFKLGETQYRTVAATSGFIRVPFKMQDISDDRLLSTSSRTTFLLTSREGIDTQGMLPRSVEFGDGSLLVWPATDLGLRIALYDRAAGIEVFPRHVGEFFLDACRVRSPLCSQGERLSVKRGFCVAFDATQDELLSGDNRFLIDHVILLIGERQPETDGPLFLGKIIFRRVASSRANIALRGIFERTHAARCATLSTAGLK